MEFYVSAFFDLSTGRPAGFSLGPIPWDQIMRYAADHGLEGQDARDFKKVIRVMDSHYLKSKEKKGKDRIGNGNTEPVREQDE